jgi:HAD superfamily hydrolase (TIGR01509 family)
VTTLVLPGRFRAAVFDMDGLLLDTEPMWHDAERELLERHGHVYSDADREAAHGRSLVDSAAVYAARLGIPAADIEREVLGIMLVHYDAGAPLRPGVGELVLGLHGRMALAVASNTGASLVRRALAASGLGVLAVVTSGVDLGRPKPLPDVYLEACRALGVAPEDAVAFEDSPTGIRSASAAGLMTVGVPDRDDVDLRAAGADVVLASLADVTIEAPEALRVGLRAPW